MSDNPPKPPQPRSATDWPWAPATHIQGFLSGRWNRRDGTVFADLEPPQVLSGTFPLNLPTDVGWIIGTCGHVGVATSWRIVAGNADGYWAISNKGVLSVAGLGMFSDVIYEISVVASNAVATSLPAEMFISVKQGTEVQANPTEIVTPNSNSPIRGGDDAQARVYIPSGVRRS